jgi:hypothetical protein
MRGLAVAGDLGGELRPRFAVGRGGDAALCHAVYESRPNHGPSQLIVATAIGACR